MKKQILNLGKALSKAEQKLINGGNMGQGGTCCLSWDNQGYSDCGYDVSHAQWAYNSGLEVGGSVVTGYCCASC